MVLFPYRGSETLHCFSILHVHHSLDRKICNCKVFLQQRNNSTTIFAPHHLCMSEGCIQSKTDINWEWLSCLDTFFSVMCLYTQLLATQQIICEQKQFLHYLLSICISWSSFLNRFDIENASLVKKNCYCSKKQQKTEMRYHRHHHIYNKIILMLNFGMQTYFSRVKKICVVILH